MKFPKFTSLFLAGALMIAACGKPSVEGSEKTYKTNKDKISALITKQPANKAEFEKKVAEFEAEYQTAMKASSDEEKIKKLGDLNSRMSTYIKSVDKPAAKGGAGAPSGKLDGAKAAPAAAPAPAGKLGGGTAPPPASGGMGGGAAQPASGGMGGGTAPTQPASGGMGGGTAPAQPASGGMGGM
jgi:hypothetical protein